MNPIRIVSITLGLSLVVACEKNKPKQEATVASHHAVATPSLAPDASGKWSAYLLMATCSAKLIE